MHETAGTESEPVIIEITGSEDVRYDAHWKVTRADDSEEHTEKKETVPTRLLFYGETVSGRVTIVSETGRLEVTVSKGGNRSRSATQGQGASLQLTVQ